MNCLSDDNRTTRRRALDHLKRETVGRSPAHPPEVLQGLMEFLVKSLLRVLSDPVEKCRELAVGLLSEYVCADFTVNRHTLVYLCVTLNEHTFYISSYVTYIKQR